MEEVLEAIEESGGIVSTVQEKLKRVADDGRCSWLTADRYIKKWKETKEAFRSEREKLMDLAEQVIVEKLTESDVDTAKWVLGKLGKSRGYGDSKVIGVVDMSNLPEDFKEWGYEKFYELAFGGKDKE